MKLKDVRDDTEKGYKVDLVHQNNQGEVIVLLDKVDKVSVFLYTRHHTHHDGGCYSHWNLEVVYDGDDFICAMAEYQKYLSSSIIDLS